jgi:predicted ATPase/DNA-binding winged helix-turn-helix (wHTH) protein
MTDQAAARVPPSRIEVVVDRRELLVDGTPARIGSRAFDVLQLLVEARGGLVTKDEIMRRVWPGVIVEESNLQVQISALRKALAEHRDAIRTIPGRGYQFIADLGEGGIVQPSAALPPAAARPLSNLPAPMTELVGRDAELARFAERIAANRLVTLIGPGGIGKTRLAIEVARTLLPQFADGAWVAELAAVSDPELVPGAVAAALGLEFSAGAASVARALAKKQLLLVLDNCEHVIEAVARLVDALLRASPGARLLATSREPLRVEGETIVRVPPLDLPENGASAPTDLLQRGAIKLFVSLAAAAEPQLAMDAHAITAAATICRRLDGIPFAIELAAARVATLGVDGIAARLDDRFKLLTGGRRTALPRQQTLRATIDWSHDALPQPERCVLRRLAIFAGDFALEAASTIAAEDTLPPAQVVEAIDNLVAKSLLAADIRSGRAQYRLLDTTRAYALEKLAEAGELAAVARAHAVYFRDLFARSQAELETQPARAWLPVLRSQLGNLRAALDWAFSSGGDIDVGVDLLVASVPLWTQLSLMEECRERVERALAQLGPAAEAPTHRNMQLYAALGTALMPNPAALAKALALAERLADNTYRLRALWGLWTNRLANVALDEALALARRFAAHAQLPIDRAIGDRMLGFSLQFLGQHEDARVHIARMLDERAPHAHGSRSVRFQFDPWVTARATLGEILWVLGFPEQAMRAVETAVADAGAIDHIHSLCNTLRKCCPVAAFCGDLAALERFTAQLFAHAAQHGFAAWHAQARCYEGLVLIGRGELAEGVAVLRTTLEGAPQGNSAMRSTYLMGALGEALGQAGEVAQGRARIEAALADAEAHHEGWCLPELLRIKGDLLLSAGATEDGEAHLLRALALARSHAALSWELRTAISLAHLRHNQGRRRDARALLGAVYERFSEGFATADLRRAKALFDALR